VARTPSGENPFRPGAGHPPPYLAGRSAELLEFDRLLTQRVVLQNLVLTGLRGVGKTVLLDAFKPRAIEKGWAWAGGDLSEPTSVSEETLATRLITDVSTITSAVVIDVIETKELGFLSPKTRHEQRLDHEVLRKLYDATPGLVADKLKRVLTLATSILTRAGRRGLILAYDEAQTLADRAEADQYPLSVLLEVFQSLQRQEVPILLIMTGLPTLFPELVEARTFAERMFRVVFLHRLTPEASSEAILRPIQAAGSVVRFSGEAVDAIVEVSGGYPYFLQFISRELFDLHLQAPPSGIDPRRSMEPILRRLDSDFFSGRWARATDRQRELLEVIAHLETAGSEFSLQEILDKAKKVLRKPFSPSHANQMLVALGASGLVYKNRHGRYSLAVPLLDQFIRRQVAERDRSKPSS